MAFESVGEDPDRPRGVFKFDEGAGEIVAGGRVVAEDHQGRAQLIGGAVEALQQRSDLDIRGPRQPRGVGQGLVEIA